MAGILLISNPTSFALTLSNPFPLRPTPITASLFSSRLPISPALTFSGDPLKTRARARGLSVVTRAGPSTGSFVLAFFLPLSLILVTVFASIRISDKLDRDYLEEVALNEAIRQSEEDEGEEGNIELPSDNNVTPTRTRRNRPIREV